MKKENYLSIILILMLLSLPIISPQQPNEIINDSLAKTVLEGTQKIRNFSEQEDKGEYLSREWTKLLQKNKAFSWIYKLNPVFKFLFGYEFSLSWAFITALLLWTLILSIIFPLTLSIFQKNLYSLAISIPITAIASQFIIPKTIEQFSKFVKNIWTNLGLIIVLIFLIVLTGIIIKKLSKKIKAWREKRKIDKLQIEAEQSRRIREGITTSQKIIEGMSKFGRKASGER